MGRPKKSNIDVLYFPARLMEKLRGMLTAKTTLMEAPSGYRKTTAAREFFRRHLPGDAKLIRHICLSEPPPVAWQRFGRTLQKIEADAGSRLARLGPPDEDTKGEAAALLRDMECAAPTWLLLDDFQHLSDLAPAEVWKALIEHDAPHLHLVILTRTLREPGLMPYAKSGLLYLGREDLRLREAETGEYFIAAGLALTEDKIRQAYRHTEGWIIALYLHLRNYLATGEFYLASDIRELLREIIWDKLDDAAKDFLLRVSPFDGYTAPQAARLLKIPELPPGASSVLKKNAFIRYDPASRRYYPHSALLDFVREVFEEAPESRRREILHQAACWCAENGERGMAIAFYFRLRDFEKILALDLSGLEENRLLDDPDRTYADDLREITAHCTREMKIRYPRSMIQLAFEFFGQGCYGELAALGAEMNELIGQTPLPPAEQNRLRGELLLLEAFTRYNSIAEMGRRIKAAAELTGGRPSLISLSNSWTFGNASVLLMYHAQAGRLDAELADMETYCPYYVALTKGHGSGGAALMKAEALLSRGETGEAEILGHKAWHQADRHGQSSLRIAADLLSGRLAILGGDAGGFSSLLERLTRQVEANPQKSDRLEADMARSFLLELLGRPGEVAEWIQRGDINKERLFAPSIPYAHLLYAKYLLLTGKPEIWLGLADEALDLAGALHYPLALIYGHIHSAAAREMRQERSLALASLRRALDLALPDRLHLPFAENHLFIAPLLEELRPELPPADEASLAALSGRQEAGSRNIMAGLYTPQGLLGLSPRELEVARLAAEGLTTGEVAQQLHISLNTVKTHLKTAYRKTGISSRRALKKMLLM